MISVTELLALPDSTLVNVYRTLNTWEWSDMLGDKPEGWDNLPNYQKPYMGECETKEKIIHPYMRAIRRRIPHEELYPGNSRLEPKFFL